jgi:hypothetical protein
MSVYVIAVEKLGNFQEPLFIPWPCLFNVEHMEEICGHNIEFSIN